MVGAMANEMCLPLSKDGQDCRELIEACDDLPESGNDFLTVGEAAVLLGVSEQTVRNWEANGRLHAIRTEGGDNGKGHRRFNRREVNELKKQEMGGSEIILPDFSVARIKSLIDQALANFDPAESVCVTIKQDALEKKVLFVIDSADGLTSIVKSFNMED